MAKAKSKLPVVITLEGLTKAQGAGAKAMYDAICDAGGFGRQSLPYPALDLSGITDETRIAVIEKILSKES